MEQYLECRTAVINLPIRRLFIFRAVAILALVTMVTQPAKGQAECGTVKDCANQMVNIVNQIKAENASLFSRISETQSQLDALSQRVSSLKITIDLEDCEMIEGKNNDVVQCAANKVLAKYHERPGHSGDNSEPHRFFCCKILIPNEQ